jgi:hypothetical protein
MAPRLASCFLAGMLALGTASSAQVPSAAKTAFQDVDRMKRGALTSITRKARIAEQPVPQQCSLERRWLKTDASARRASPLPVVCHDAKMSA